MKRGQRENKKRPLDSVVVSYDFFCRFYDVSKYTFPRNVIGGGEGEREGNGRIICSSNIHALYPKVFKRFIYVCLSVLQPNSPKMLLRQYLPALCLLAVVLQVSRRRVRRVRDQENRPASHTTLYTVYVYVNRGEND